MELIDDPELIQRITARVDSDYFNRDTLRFAPGLGFVAMQEEGCTYALGFCVGQGNEEGTLPDMISPITELRDVPARQRTIDRQGKGVGPRLHNTLESLSGMKEPQPAALYALQIDPDVTIWDGRGEHDSTLAGKGRRIGRHLGRILEAEVYGLEKVVDTIHASYGSADVVLMNQSPRAALLQSRRRVAPVPGLDARFLLVRDKDLLLYKVGNVR